MYHGHSYSQNDRWFAMIRGSSDSALGEFSCLCGCWGFQRIKAEKSWARESAADVEICFAYWLDRSIFPKLGQRN
jgi:hypothetical protein